MKHRLSFVLALSLVSILMLSLLAGCAPSPQGSSSPQLTITDQLGRTVKLDKIPQRIVSLAPSNTEILFAIGLVDRIVGVTDYCDYPPEAKQKPKIGGFSTPNIESVIAASPDLILATSIHEKTAIPQLEERGLTVVALAPKTFDEVMAAIMLVGNITGKEKEATALLSDMKQRIKAVTDKTSGLSEQQKLRTLYLVWHDPPMVAAGKTLQDEVIAKAGGKNIAYELSDYAKISLEAIIQADPEVMIAGVGHGSGTSQTLEFLKNEDRLKAVSARRDGRIYGVDGNIVSRPGPRIIDGLEEFARFIHPELFK